MLYKKEGILQDKLVNLNFCKIKFLKVVRSRIFFVKNNKVLSFFFYKVLPSTFCYLNKFITIESIYIKLI